MSNIREFLKERKASYGNAWTLTGQVIKPVASHLTNLVIEFPELYTPWVMILNKLIRILVVPNRADSWYDIIGYATLVYESLKKTEE